MVEIETGNVTADDNKIIDKLKLEIFLKHGNLNFRCSELTKTIPITGMNNKIAGLVTSANSKISCIIVLPEEAIELIERLKQYTPDRAI